MSNIIVSCMILNGGEADGKIYTFYLNCSEQEQSVSDVHGYDLITEKQMDGTLTLPKYGVAILA